MTVSTAGIDVKARSLRVRAAVELVSSMRFAISLLTVICIASVIGTVLKQNEPLNNYINQFGPFWSEVFGALDLYAVYSAWWFLLILAFLVLSTSLCIARNTPKILNDLRLYKENIREQSLNAFPHKAQGVLHETAEVAAHRLGTLLAGQGWKVRLQRRETVAGTGWMVAAKSGAANKLGYLAAHTAIVLICLGGLFDGDLMVRAQTWFNGKEPYRGSGLVAEVPERHRLSESNPTFRGNLEVTEGTQSGTAILGQRDGVLLQPLPFDVELKKFVVEYYSTGMPKLFASDIVIHDRLTGESRPARVEVNHPVRHNGIEIYQSSFADGGSLLKLKALPMAGNAAQAEISGRVGSSQPIQLAGQRMTLELTDLRVINVENMQGGAAVDVRKVDLRQSIENHLGAGNKTATERKLVNVGPSVTYKLRDEAGQAREFQNYMLPLDMDGKRVMLLGVRDTPAEPFRYLRLPVDDKDGLEGFVRLRTALADDRLRAEAVRRYVRQAADPKRTDLTEALTQSAQRTLDIFAGAVPPITPAGGAEPPRGGLQALSAFIEANVPAAERERAGDVLLRILNGTLIELYQLARHQAGWPDAPRDEATATFMTQAVLSLSDAFFYPVPVAFVLTDFQQVQASVFQVARAPGKNIVYLGCALLILGVFAMLYVRERRLWVWLVARDDGSGCDARMALSINRKMLDTDREFAELTQRLLPSPNGVNT
ncbi:MAG TPA: cytochrome c biogenesis protein ResB [Macromonas sp.]|nr:cytochrome c biogenesis protein ResB [Macromonas sp.]